MHSKCAAMAAFAVVAVAVLAVASAGERAVPVPVGNTQMQMRPFNRYNAFELINGNVKS
jgi:hypothetical protein